MKFLPSAAVVFVFAGIVLWFNVIDFYHLHFFDRGKLVVADNLLRILFTGIFTWLIYALGAGVGLLTMKPEERAGLTAAERAVLGFGIGVGIWHVLMLVLGILGFYYRGVMAGTCFIVLLATLPHFAKVTVRTGRVLKRYGAQLRHGRGLPQTFGIAVVVFLGALLLLVRGLFPGGGSDYYNHYFRYFLEVLNNHDLAPNDVWYHYYYSKGAGLTFLGMLLTDPEAPALTTFTCVAIAAIAIATLSERLACHSIWPVAGAILYLFFYLISPGMAFQKHHEETTALVILTVWALCMERRGPSKPYLVMASATGIAAAVLTQAIGIFLFLFVAVLCVWFVVFRRWKDASAHAAVVVAMASALLAMFALSYWETGLASDQALDFMLRFADFSRLDRWGVIPQIIAIAWIKDNYRALEPPFGIATFKELGQFMRIGFLWPFLIGPLVAVGSLGATIAHIGGYPNRSGDAAAISFAVTTLGRLSVIVVLFIAIALAIGPAQSVSFTRLSTFFVPLLILWTTVASVWILNWRLPRVEQILLQIALPIALLFGVGIASQFTSGWINRIYLTGMNSLRFLSGQFSLAEAYGRAESPFPFGAINPRALAVMRQVPEGTPIWSTNVHCYCMVPGCHIESVISYKMSGRLDEILAGEPELAKRQLQEAGLNYFVFVKDYEILDLLPYSRLFAPDTIGHYLGVKWTDGSTFLLTWIGPETSPIGTDFLSAYSQRRATADPRHLFRFEELAAQISAIAPRMRVTTRWEAANKLLIWRECVDCDPASTTTIKP